MNGLTEPRPYSWVKHAVRRWKELYYEILKTDGQTEWLNPLSTIFSHDNLAVKTVESPPPVPAPAPTKPETTHPTETTPTRQPKSKSQRKQGQGRFLVKIKEIQALLIRPRNLF